MPTISYTENEFKSTETKFLSVMHALRDIAYQQSNFIKNAEYAEREKQGKNANCEKYPYIPIRLDDFLHCVDNVSSLIKNAEEKAERYKQPKFVDAGCGYPITLLLAKQYNFDVIGYELDDKVIEASRGLTVLIKKQDILTANYHTFDVVYYYCPFENRRMQEQLEAKIEAEMKVGAYLIAALKQAGQPSKKNFKHIEHKGDIQVWQKIK